MESLKNNMVIKKLNSFFDSYYYPVFVFAVVLLTHTFALDLLGFIITVVCFCLATLVCENMRHVVPFILMFIYVVSTQNSPGYGFSEYYASKTTLLTFLILGILIIISITIRVILKKEYKFFFKNNKLLLGVILLIPCFLFAGIFSGKVNYHSLVVSALMIILLPIVYIVFSPTISTKDDNLIYFSRSAVLALILISLEIFYVYLLKYEIGRPLDQFWKGEIVIGSMVSNSASEFIVMLLPFCFYLAYKEKYGFIYYIIASLSIIAVYFTLSRASLLFFFPIYIVGSIFLCFKGKNKNLFRVLFVSFTVIVIIFTYYILNSQHSTNLFAFFKNSKLDSHNRFEIWKHHFEEFKTSPIFGVGFSTYMQSNPLIDQIYKGLAHNIVVQIICSTGIIGTLLFSYHVFEILKLFIKNFNAETVILVSSILLLFGLSLLDQIFFFPNFTIIYTFILIFLEKQTKLYN